MAKILIVDDSKIMRKSLSTILSEAGHIIIAEAENGSQACIEFERHTPDLITMDINMPYVSGIEALKRIISKHPNTNIVMLSSEVNNRVICDAINAGAKAIVSKPFNIQVLLDTIDNVLNSESTLRLDYLKRIYNKLDMECRVLT